ncbi:MAG: hypothetical protein M1834_003714 [Cirrosporium novae-zelandiae]|nr:MAG: hypothetical protein M1834_003714 [Cirrosporium novae-zelandiae]
MPPRSLTSSFSAAADANNEVVCPLKNHDGSNCRKRCIGEKRYRSMQEHIRRAHPEHYISKLPATEESFQLMISTPPSDRPPPPQPQQQQPTSVAPKHHQHSANHARERDSYYEASRAKSSSTLGGEAHALDASAAAALASLHSHRAESEWDSDGASDADGRAPPGTSHSIELPPIRNHLKQESVPPFPSSRPRELLPSFLANSPPGRSSTLPPLQRKPNRPRKSSVTQNARKPKHERQRSKDHPPLKHLSLDGIYGYGSRKALSVEPQSSGSAYLQGKRWEDLIEAATSATEVESDRDLTPVPPSPSTPLFGLTRNRSGTMPPFFPSSTHYQAYQASPLQRALTPPPPDSARISAALEPFPSVESCSTSAESGRNFHMPRASLTYMDSSPAIPPSSTISGIEGPRRARRTIEHYCASCQGIFPLRGSYACTECICGVCADCAGGITREGKPCPSCGVRGGVWKAFRINLKL